MSEVNAMRWESVTVAFPKGHNASQMAWISLEGKKEACQSSDELDLEKCYRIHWKLLKKLSCHVGGFLMD